MASGADFFWRWIETNAFCYERADLVGGIGLDHHDTPGIEALRQPARQHRAAHLACAGEDDGGLQSLERAVACN